MTPYQSKSGKRSGVTGFKVGSDYIDVQFNHSEVYRYSYKSADPSMIDEMKERALKQSGLSTFISREDPGYERG